MEKVDVCINVYGKPYQTIVTLKSLIKYSGDLIDKIYFIEEAKQPEVFPLDYVIESINFENIIHFKAKYHLWVNPTDINRYVNEEDYRLSLRYQYGIEKTDKKHLLIIHNDVLFKGNVIKGLLDEVEGYSAIGQVGQCWNCPMKTENVCGGDKYELFIPNYEEVIKIVNKHKGTRTDIFRNLIDRVNPMPLPECRLNEWVALINMNDYRKEVVPNSDVLPFGGYFKMDLADEWFRRMILKGYKIKDVDINKWCTHGYFPLSKTGAGHPALFDKNRYNTEEILAKNYIKENLK